MTTQEILSNATDKMEKAVASLKKEFANLEKTVEKSFK